MRQRLILRPPLFLLALALLLAGPPARRPRADDGRERVRVPLDLVTVDDGDSVLLRWPAGHETVRVLGIDTPEIFHPEHDLPYAQPFGDAATAFLRGCLAVTDKVELLRSGQKDPYGRTLGYLYLDGRNYSVLVVAAGLAVETVSHFGDNGLKEPAAEVLAAAKAAGPVPFEAPYRYRARMHDVSKYLRGIGRYPCPPPSGDDGGR